MHQWGDGFKYFYEVGEAADWIGKFCRKWGRISVTTTKEKWGRACVYCHFGISSFHSIIYPGYVYNQFPDWLWKLDCNFSRIFWYKKYTYPLQWLIQKYQTFIYR